MATTVAHGLIGVMFYCAVRPLNTKEKKLPLTIGMLVLAAFVANVPDLDMIVSLLLYADHRTLHGGVSHSLSFAMTGALVIWLVARNTYHRTQLSIVIALLLSSHVLVDFLTGPKIGYYPSTGTPAFWPLIEGRLHSHVTLFKGVEHSQILPGGLITAAWELVILSPLTLLTIFFSNRKCSQAHRVGGI